MTAFGQPALSREQPALSRKQPALSREQPALSRESPALSRGQPALRHVAGNPLPRVLWWTALFALSLTLLCLGAELIAKFALHLGYPYDWPLMPPEDPFRDIYLYKPRYAFFHSPSFFTFNGAAYMYPAPLAVVYRLFYFFPHPTRIFLGVVLAIAFGAICLLGRAMVRRGVEVWQTSSFLAIMLMTSFALAFELEQGNVEIVIVLLVAAGIGCTLRERGWSAAACFGIAGAMKIFPLVFLGLLLSRRMYRQTGFAVVMACVTTLAGLWLVCPDLGASWRETQAALDLFRTQYAITLQANYYDHSLFGIFKDGYHLVHRAMPAQEISRYLTGYLAVASLSGILLYILLIRKLPVVNQVLCLTVASILLPPVSYEYTLMHLYMPAALLTLLAIDAGSRKLPGLMPVLLILTALVAPESEVIVHARTQSGQIKCVLLILLFAMALIFRFHSRFDRTREIPGPPVTV